MKVKDAPTISRISISNTPERRWCPIGLPPERSMRQLLAGLAGLPMGEQPLGRFGREAAVLLFHLAELFLAVVAYAGKIVQHRMRDVPIQPDGLAHHHRAERFGIADQPRDQHDRNTAQDRQRGNQFGDAVAVRELQHLGAGLLGILAEGKHQTLRRDVFLLRNDSAAGLVGKLREHPVDGLALARPAASSMRWRASSVAWLSSRLNNAGEMSARRVIASVRSLSPLARIVSIDMPVFERRAPALTATLVTTSRSPRSTSTSVTTGLSCPRSAILLRCDWPLLSAISTRFWSVSRGDCASTGPATVMSSSAARRWMTLCGALAIGATSRLSSTRARLST